MQANNMNTKMNGVALRSTTFPEIGKYNLVFRESVGKGEVFDLAKHQTYKSMDFSVSELPEHIVQELIVHGLKQKLADALAFTGESKAEKTIQDAVNSVSALWEQLKGGEWNAKKGAKPKAPSMTFSAMEQKFLDGVKAGITTFAAAKDLYKLATGAELPQPDWIDEKGNVIPDNDDDDTEN